MIAAIAFGPRAARRYLAFPNEDGSEAKGWRQLVWTKNLPEAELFSSAEKATAFAETYLIHSEWAIVGVPPTSLPGSNDLGGSPVALAA